MIRESAPGKVNLLLHVGPTRADGLHEICSLFASLDLADELTIERSDRDAVVCAGVTGPNLAEQALTMFRDEIDLPPLRVTIDKRIPVAAGMGGGSADAAAVLRAANELAGRPFDSSRLRELGAAIGADVPSQVEPRHALVTGAGEEVEPIALPEMALVLVPGARGLSTPEVYARADELGSTRGELHPDAVRALASEPLAELARALENDLEPAALSLRPEIAGRLEALRGAGALAALVTGSGPTAFGVFPDRAAAARAAARISGSLVTMVRPE
jgi:4-diphosphocytidyl-2-C-methyl-D-erythritol kinase